MTEIGQTAPAEPALPLPPPAPASPPRERIHAFLGAVRRRAIGAAALEAAALTGTALLLALLVLALLAAWLGPAAFWPTVSSLVLLLLVMVGVAFGGIIPARRLRSPRAVAQFVGRRQPDVASDLVSAVELDVPSDVDIPHGGSRVMARAFHGAVAEAVKPIDVRRLVPFGRARKAGVALLGAALLLGAAVLWAPKTVGRGLELLRRFPTRFEGARVASEPLIGEMRITYRYPGYTGLPPRTVEGSTGDVVALKGTEVTLETRTLRSGREALLLLGDNGDRGELPAKLTDGKLSASLRVMESGSYRVWLAPLIGRPMREQRAHRIVVEADRPPEVDIVGPADRLEIATPRPIEVGYSARDDFGLGKVELVYRVDDGPEQRVPLKDARGAKNAKERTIFEPATAAVSAGSRIAYRIEAKDRDDVSGAKTGSSRTLYIVIQNPRENLDEQLAREKEVLDKLLGSLADRLEMADEPPANGALPPSASDQLGKWLGVHEAEASSVTLLGRIIDDERRAGSTSKALVNTLAGIADRLGRHLRDESAVLGALRAKADEGALTTSQLGRLGSGAGKHVQELETSVLLLDDLIGRQRLEDLASLGKELTSAYKRLQDLLSRYNATKDEALRAQIAREIQMLRSRIEELARKVAEVRARNEVPSEWQNMPDLKEAMEKVNRLDSLLEKGDAQSLQQALSQLGETLQSLQDALDQNAQDFGGERFQEENKAVSEVMKKLGDLEGDQRGLADDSGRLASEVDAELGRKLEEQMNDFLAKAKEKAETLRKKLAATPPRELGESGSEELARAQEAARQLKRMLPAKDFAEAKKEADRIASSLRRVRRSLDAASTRKAVSPNFEPFSGEMAGAAELAEEMSSELEKLAPRPESAMSPAQREQAQGMSERQSSLAERARQLGEELGKKGGEIPGADKARDELQGIGQQMGQASDNLGQGATKEGSGKAQEAADRLAKLREQMGKGRQMGRSRERQEPVRIPGADESKAPREWRQELLEAMREKGPDRFREEVRRYYEELVK